MDHSNRAHLDYQLGGLENSLLDLSSMVEKAVDNAIAALKHRDHRQAPSWREHLDINEVMLATSLAAHGFLALSPPAA